MSIVCHEAEVYHAIVSKRRLLIAALAFAAGCSSPTSPAPPGTGTPAPAVNPLTEPGTWSGFFRIDTCTATPDPCYLDERPRWFRLRTHASGSALEGIFDSEWQDMPVSVTGTLNPDGSASLTGSLMTLPPAPVRERVRVSRLDVTASATAGLAGTLSLRKRTSATETITATILSASMEPFSLIDQREFQGTWEGYGQVTACRGDCWIYDEGQLVPLSIRLTQRGTEVTGEVFGVAATGGVSGGVLQLSGEKRRTLEPGDFGYTLTRFQTFSMTVDALGRLRGGFSALVRGMKRVSGPRPNEPFEGVTEISLLSVARRAR